MLPFGLLPWTLLKSLRVQQDGLGAGIQRELCLDRRLALFSVSVEMQNMQIKTFDSKVWLTWSNLGQSFRAVGRWGIGLQKSYIHHPFHATAQLANMVQHSKVWLAPPTLHRQRLSRKTVHVNISK